MSIEMVGLADIVRVHGAARPETVAVVYEGRSTTYGALDRASSRIASGLVARRHQAAGPRRPPRQEQ
jgi:non-ribosomal peptide synthetase component E (peptide arylation enzyme)